MRNAEDLVRTRDRVLAVENEAESARMASVDARLGKFEAELAQTQVEERALAAELASAQEALSTAEANLAREAQERANAREGSRTRA
jgi:hypothetical protein